MRNAEMRYLRSVLNFGIKRGLLETNPVDRLDFADIAKKEVLVIPVELVERMLVDARQNDPQLLPFLVLGFYAGLRPIGELQKLRWENVSLEDKLVTVPVHVSKTRTRRFITLSDNAVEWLRLCEPAGGVVPWTFDELRNRREANWSRVSGGKKWVHQGMRHSFCSYWLNAFEDVNKLLLISGHTSPQIMWRRYFRAVPKSEAEKFFSIRPA
jgi:integrase